jgi:hypothetical protein
MSVAAHARKNLLVLRLPNRNARLLCQNYVVGSVAVQEGQHGNSVAANKCQPRNLDWQTIGTNNLIIGYVSVYVAEARIVLSKLSKG